MQRTEDLLDKFSLKDAKNWHNKAETPMMYQTIDNRYYKPKISAKNRIGAIFTAKVLDSINTKKHIRVRRNSIERNKLEYLESELK